MAMSMMTMSMTMMTMMTHLHQRLDVADARVQLPSPAVATVAAGVLATMAAARTTADLQLAGEAVEVPRELRLGHGEVHPWTTTMTAMRVVPMLLKKSQRLAARSASRSDLRVGAGQHEPSPSLRTTKHQYLHQHLHQHQPHVGHAAAAHVVRLLPASPLPVQRPAKRTVHPLRRRHALRVASVLAKPLLPLLARQHLRKELAPWMRVATEVATLARLPAHRPRVNDPVAVQLRMTMVVLITKRATSANPRARPRGRAKGKASARHQPSHLGRRVASVAVAPTAASTQTATPRVRHPRRLLLLVAAQPSDRGAPLQPLYAAKTVQAAPVQAAEAVPLQRPHPAVPAALVHPLAPQPVRRAMQRRRTCLASCSRESRRSTWRSCRRRCVGAWCVPPLHVASRSHLVLLHLCGWVVAVVSLLPWVLHKQARLWTQPTL